MWTALITSCAFLLTTVSCQDGAGFSAGFAGTLALSGQTILFDQVTTNLGQLYVPGQGIFSCPAAFRGLYHFQVSIRSASLSTAEARLMYHTEGVEPDRILGTVRTDDGLDSATLEATLECGVSSTDNVYVQGVSGQLYNDADTLQNTFSGFFYRRIVA